MSETERLLTDQEQAQAQRVEEMRKAHEQQASEDANAAPTRKNGASKEAASPDFARVKVRGTPNDAETEESLQAWEKSIATDAAANAGVVPPKATFRFDKTIVRLNGELPPVPAASDTETELNGLIAECRFLMREIAFNSARLTYDADDRIRFLSAAESMALTAAKIGDTVGRLRGGGAPVVETRRHELVYTHIQSSPPSPPGEAKSENQ